MRRTNGSAVAEALEGADQAGHRGHGVAPHLVGEGREDLGVEGRPGLVHAVLENVGDDLDGALSGVGHVHCLVHGFPRPGVDGLAEPLEGGLAGDSEQVPDLLPGVAGVPALLHGQLEHLPGEDVGVLGAPARSR